MLPGHHLPVHSSTCILTPVVILLSMKKMDQWNSTHRPKATLNNLLFRLRFFLLIFTKR